MIKNFLIVAFFFFSLSCTSKKDDPIILPPNFAEMPDPNNPEKPAAKQSEESVARLKDLLLKSDE